MSGSELDEIYNTALQVTKEAGQMIRDAFVKEKNVDTKLSAADLVTETDSAIEKFVHEFILARFPDHKFIGEETTSETGVKHQLTDSPTWIIDPIDGTSNFVHSILEVAFSLGVTVNKKVVIGIVYIPMREELFTARLGQGAYLNGKKITANQTKDLQSSVIIMEIGSSRDPKILEDKLKNMHAMITNSRGIRVYGSAAIDMCNVAAGRGDAYVQYGIHIWDFVAGMLVATEAGAVAIDPTGSDLDLMRRRVLCACTSDLAKQMIPHLIQIDFGTD